jgi:trimeric autotransporter adhesin
MKTNRMKTNFTSLRALLAMFCLLNGAIQLHSQGTAFVFQGVLSEGTGPATGIYDLRFAIYDSTNYPGTLIAGPITNSSTGISNGLFTVTLDFGPGVFTGPERWLDISVRTNGASTFTSLDPRQKIGAAPYAIYSGQSASANSVVASSVGAPQLATPGSPTAGQVLAFSGTGLAWTNPAAVAGAWSLNGNTGTTSSNFLGTADGNSLEIHAGNNRAFWLGWTVVVGGSTGNRGFFKGDTIGGGGTTEDSQSFTNVVIVSNIVISSSCTGCPGNPACAGLPCYLIVTTNFSVTTNYATYYPFANLIGERWNPTTHKYDVIDPSIFATISGGMGNQILSHAAVIAGGRSNLVNIYSVGSVIGGGDGNVTEGLTGDHAVIGGGFHNTVRSDNSTIGGGAYNTITRYALASIICGGDENLIEGDFGSPSDYGTIGGGNNNVISSNCSAAFIGGGVDNRARYGAYTTIAGGFFNLTGYAVTEQGDYSSVGGGYGNAAQGDYSTVPGGYQNWAAGNYSFAAGNRAKAVHTGSFVWADSRAFDYYSTGNNTARFRCTSGFGITTGIDGSGNETTGAYIAGGSGTWTSVCDRNSKTNFAPVDARAVLEGVLGLPIRTWNYKPQDASVRHIGPVAQDFRAAFGLGDGDTHIAVVDADGVALAAIQGLNQKLEDRSRQLEAENAELKQRLEALEKIVRKLN